MKQGKYADACPKLEESQRLDPAVGTQFNLASCYEKQGKTASAWATYLEVAAATKKLGQPDREKVARDRAEALEPKLSRLTVVVPEAARQDGLKIQRDGVEVGSALWGVPAPVDPGKVAVTASAPGKLTWTETADVGEAASVEVEVPKLEDDPNAGVSGGPAGTGEGGQPGAPAGSDQSAESSRPVPTSVWVGVGVTGALTVGAVVTGLMALGKRSDFDGINDAAHSQDEKQAAHDDAVTMGLISTVLTGAAVVGAGVTGYLFFSRPESPAADQAKAYVAPWIGVDGGGLAVGGVL